MGFFSKSKKSAPAPTQNKPGVLERFALKRHETGFLKHAAKDNDGYPVASRIYWNVNAAISTMSVMLMRLMAKHVTVEQVL